MFTSVQTEKLQASISEGNDHYRHGDYAAMLSHYQAVRLFFEDAEPFYRRQYLINIGIAYYETGYCERAVDAFIKALDVRGDEDEEDIASCSASLAAALLRLNRPDEALTFLEQPENFFRGQFARYQLGEILETKAQALLATGETALAEVTALEAVNLLHEFVMDKEACKKDHSKAFARAANTLAVCAFEAIG